MSDPVALPSGFIPGVHYDMPEENYFAIEAMSQSGAKEMRRSANHYRFARANPKESTEAMQIGRLLHGAVLEPHSFEELYVLAPECDRRSKVNKAIWDEAIERAKGKILISEEKLADVMHMRDAVLRHHGAKRLLDGTKREVVLMWIDGKYKVPCKARMDLLANDDVMIVSDVKTTDDASAEEFGRSIANFDYHAQGAHYISGCEHVLNKTPAFAMIVVEKTAPYGVACYSLQSNHILVGARLMDMALKRYKQALDTGWWAMYPETIEPAQMPGWALRIAA